MMINNKDTNNMSMSNVGGGRILCDVTNCVYNDDNQNCTAKEIKVGPQYASSSADTLCATFKQ